MDWSRAKTLFIVSFLILNVLLAGQVGLNYRQQAEMTQWNQSSYDELNQMLLAKHIRIETDIPKEMPKMSFLYVQYVSAAADKANAADPKMRESVATFDPPLAVKRPLQADAVEDALKSKFDWRGMQKDSALSTPDQWVYNQVEQGMPLFGIAREVKFAGAGIGEVRQVAVRVLSEGSQRQVISAFTALRTLVENVRLPLGAQITDIRIGYHGQLYNSDVQVLAPAWRIMLQDGAQYFVNGITGAIDTPQQPGDTKSRP